MTTKKDCYVTYNRASFNDFAAWKRCTDCGPTAHAGRIVKPRPITNDHTVFRMRGSGLNLEYTKMTACF